MKSPTIKKEIIKGWSKRPDVTKMRPIKRDDF